MTPPPQDTGANQLSRITLNGFKSINNISLELRALNVLIGANGSGKSNLVSFFKLLNEMLGDRLQKFVAECGYAHSLLHYGPEVTREIAATLAFETPTGSSTYAMRLVFAAGDTLIFSDEHLTYQRPGFPRPQDVSLGAGHNETRLTAAADDDTTARVIRRLLCNCRGFQFHDTSATARILQQGYIDANKPLAPDAGNLAAVLYRIRTTQPTTYRRIVGTIQQIAPFFRDFVLEPSTQNNRYITLNWQEKKSDSIFGPHQLSDGTLRAMALVTLLLQTEDDLPDFIIIDEPELGLHPYAINVLASLLEAASQHCQVMVATQSVPLLSQFDPEDVIVVEREEREGAGSRFERLDSKKLEDWLDDYSLGELWARNVIGGGPA